MKELLQIQSRPDLADAFHVVEKWPFDKTWRFVVQMLTIIPTTVVCEPSFIFFKRTLHINMSEETAKILLMARLSHYDYDYDLLFE